jgi:hypothetical protein
MPMDSRAIVVFCEVVVDSDTFISCKLSCTGRSCEFEHSGETLTYAVCLPNQPQFSDRGTGLSKQVSLADTTLKVQSLAYH